MHKEWKIQRSGSTIRIVNSWLGGCKLYVDGDLKDHDKSMVTTSKYPLLSGSFVNSNGEREVVEVFAKSGVLSVEFVVTSNGEEIFRTKH